MYMWINQISHLTIKYTTFPPTTLDKLADLEHTLSIVLPSSLRELLLETDGVWGEYEFGLIWDTTRIVSTNVSMRTTPDFVKNYMPFEPLLFFADADNGDQFAFRVINGIIKTEDVFAWIHEDDSRKWVAPSLYYFLDWFITGKITT